MIENKRSIDNIGLLCMARVSPLNRLSEYLSGEKVSLESNYPPLRHAAKYKVPASAVNYFFYGLCNYVLPASFDQKKSRAIGMLFGSEFVDNNSIDITYFPFDSGACMDGRYLPHITDQELGLYQSNTLTSTIFREKVVRYFGTNMAYYNGENLSNLKSQDANEEKLINLYNSIPNERVDIRGKTIEILLPIDIDFSNLQFLILPEQSIKMMGINIGELRNRWPHVAVETYDDIYDSSPMSDTRTIQKAVFAFYDRKGYFSQ